MKARESGICWWLCLVFLLNVLIACGPMAPVYGQAAVESKPAANASTGAEFPELSAADQAIERFVARAELLVDGRSIRIPSRVAAYEENRHFVYAVADIPGSGGAQRGARDGRAGPRRIRRLMILQPSIYLVDDIVTGVTPTTSVRERIEYRTAPTVSGERFRVVDNDEELVYETLWPVDGTSPGELDFSYDIDTKPEDGVARFLHLFHVRTVGDEQSTVKAVLKANEGHFALTITTADRVFRLSLPQNAESEGRIAIDDPSGKTILPRRPLAAGVLPHGPKGSALIERWDRAYRDGKRPPWDTGLAAEDLVQAVENRDLKPCRTVVLGCGSGTNAIYLAGKGFDVTGIDLAPTALSIAEAKAKKAGVRVRWMLADVLALPELEPFDLIFDRGCYHNVRYVDREGFIESVRRLSRPGTQFLVLSLNRDGPPGVREHHMREDFSKRFEFTWLRESDIKTGPKAENRRASWSALLQRNEAP